MRELIQAAAMLGLGVAAYAAPSSNVLASLPMQFEQDSHARWTARAPGAAFLVESTGIQMIAGDRLLGIEFNGSRSGHLLGQEKASNVIQRFHGTQHGVVQPYRRVTALGIYKGVDVTFYGTGNQLEYDFNIAPSADPKSIRISFHGADSQQLTPGGAIALTVGDQVIEQLPPAVYQRLDSGEILAVSSRYRDLGNGYYGIDVAKYDRTRELIVDPQIVYQTPIGGSASDAVTAITRDARGFLYLGGYTYSNDFPFGPISYSIFRQDRDAFVMKLDPFAPANNVIKYSTFFGGGLYEDLNGLAVDSAGLIYLTGTTRSGDLPTKNEYSKFINENDHPYVAVLDPTTDGSAGLRYSTYFGGSGSEQASGFAVAGGKIYLAGWSTSEDLPTVGAYQSKRGGSYDAFVSVFDISKTNKDTLVSGTFIGGTGQDMARTLAVDPSGAVWIGGLSFSSDFPTTVGAYKPFSSDAGDGFLAKLDMAGGKLLYSTYVGGSAFDEVKKLVIEPSGRIAAAGYTLSPNFPTTSNAAQPAYGGNSDAFLMIIDPQQADFTKALIYSTFFGGSDGEVPYDLRRDTAGRYYLCGYTLSADLRTTSGAIASSTGGQSIDGFVAGIDPRVSGSSALFYGSYVTSPGYQIVQNIDVDRDGYLYVGGLSTGNVYVNGPTNRFGDGNPDGFLFVIQQ